MNNSNLNTPKNNRKRIILRLGIIWLSILLFLTFFSNTIYALNLPGVAIAFPTEDIVTTTNRAEGALDFIENRNIYADHAGRLRLNLREGDRFEEGDLLFSIYVETEDLEDRLENERHRLQRTRLSRRASESALATLSPTMPLAAATTNVDTSSFDNEAARLALEISRQEEEYNLQQGLFNAGLIPLEDLITERQRLEDLRRSQTLNEEERRRAIEAHTESQARSREEHGRQEQDARRIYAAERARLQNEINLSREDESEILRQIARLESQLEVGGGVHVFAEESGIVREIPNLSDGMHVNRNQLIMHLGILDGDSYRVFVYFPESVGILPAGTEVRVDIRALREFGLTGEIVRMTPSAQRLRTEIRFETDHSSVNGGEGVTVIIERFSELFGEVLPNSAIRRDQVGYFILYAARERNTLLGYSYVARFMRIQIFEGGRGDRYSAFWMMSEPDGPIIIQSDRPITQGDRVRLVADQ